MRAFEVMRDPVELEARFRNGPFYVRVHGRGQDLLR
jgi:hypothetical protein